MLTTDRLETMDRAPLHMQREYDSMIVDPWEGLDVLCSLRGTESRSCTWVSPIHFLPCLQTVKPLQPLALGVRTHITLFHGYA